VMTRAMAVDQDNYKDVVKMMFPGSSLRNTVDCMS